MKRKKQKFTFDDLEQDAKTFIECKVRVLGSVEQVKNSYRRDDLVSHYAVAYAEGHYGPNGKHEIRSRPRLSL